MKTLLTYLSMVLGLMTVTACNYRNPKSVQLISTTPTYVVVKEQIFKTHGCLDCHSGPSAEAGVDLSDYSEMLNSGIGVVVPGDFLNSTLYLNVQSGRMPPGGPRLSDAEIKMLSEWIKAGAKQN